MLIHKATLASNRYLRQPVGMGDTAILIDNLGILLK
jgi:hypothetical protein